MKPLAHGQQQGFAAIVAIFLVLVLAAFGAYMVNLSNAQQLNSAQDLQGSRAYWAARAGLEWAIARTPAGTTTCWANTSWVLDGYTVNVSCSLPPAPYIDSQAGSPTATLTNVYIFQLSATATTAGTVGGLGYAERSVSASLER